LFVVLAVGPTDDLVELLERLGKMAHKQEEITEKVEIMEDELREIWSKVNGERL